LLRSGAMTDMTVLARAMTDVVPAIVDQLLASRSPRLHREAMSLLERPLLVHALAMTGGNQLRAARLLGVNRNTLRKRCRELQLALPRAARGPTAAAPAKRPPRPELPARPQSCIGEGRWRRPSAFSSQKWGSTVTTVA
jgi:DNA-binding protein Fis